MALTLTHLRFARDIMERLDIKDRASYYAGVVYPDSRYVTGIHRSQTHGDGNPVDPFAAGLTDFEKGWSAHEYYDRRAHVWYSRLSPWSEKVEAEQRKWWLYITAVKAVEDLQSFDVTGGLGAFAPLTPPVPPRGEDHGLLTRFYRLNEELYARRPTIDDYDVMWHECRISRDLIDGLNENVRLLLRDEEKQREIAGIYPAVLEETRRK